jgi:ketosteroid isomerase-like protein
MVSRVLVLLTLLALQGAPARSQAASARSSGQDNKRLIELEDSWATALVKRDADRFQRMLAPGFVYTEDDKLMGRDQVLHDVVSGPDTVTAAHNEDMVPHLFGTTGIVTGWLIVRGRSGGKPFEHRYRFTDTWIKRNGDWQIVAAQDYLLPRKG